MVSKLKIIPLGGLGEIGKNMTAYEFGGDIIVVDCGMGFPDEDMYGVDIVLPDISYLKANAEKIRGLILTHGHEDHIGAVPYVLKEIDMPIYTSPLTAALVELKLEEHELLYNTQIFTKKAGSSFRLGCFTVEFIHVNHSIPDAVALAIHTPAGVIIQTGDFKIDYTPIMGDVIDLPRFGELGSRGFQILGYYPNLEELNEQVPEPERGDAYGIGTQAPYDIYVYDGVGQQWVNNGSIQGPAGSRGEDGATFIPSVDDYGNLSWINDGGLDNPETVNIRGAKGDPGEKGEDGSSPYELAVQEGFSGTEATFNWSLAHIASHAAQHSAGGTDPLTIDSDAIEAAAVTRSKLAADVKTLAFLELTVEPENWQEDETYGDYPFRAAVALEGVTEDFAPSVTFAPEDALENIFAPVAETYDGGIYIYACESPAETVTIPAIVCIPVR